MDESNQSDEHEAVASEQEMLRQYLKNRNVPCPACGYNIKQLLSNTCPECGRELMLSVGIVGLSNLWITALVGAIVPAACGLPFHLLILIALSHGATPSDALSEPEGIIFLLLVFYALSCAVFSILLIVMRQRFMRLRIQAQGTIATLLVIAAVFAGIVALALIGSL